MMFPKTEEIEKTYAHTMCEIKKLNKENFLSARSGFRYYFFRKICALKIFGKLFGAYLRKIEESSRNYEVKDVLNDYSFVSEKKIAVYTVVFGGYDNINEPVVIPDNCDFYLITDKPIKTESNSIWVEKNLKEHTIHIENLSNIEKNRYCKMFPNKLFPEYEYSIYIDGNVQVMTDPTEFIQEMNSYGLKLHKHYRRECVYEEINKCIDLGKDNKDRLLTHKEHLIEKNMPEQYGMLEAPIIVREHNNPKCIKLMEEWWHEFSHYSKRDQISLPYVLWKNDISIDDVGTLGNDIYSNYAFRKKKHNSI